MIGRGVRILITTPRSGTWSEVTKMRRAAAVPRRRWRGKRLLSICINLRSWSDYLATVVKGRIAIFLALLMAVVTSR
jgi:hypothetical protein